MGFGLGGDGSAGGGVTGQTYSTGKSRTYKRQGPPQADFNGAAQQQMNANRPDQNTDFASLGYEREQVAGPDFSAGEDGRYDVKKLIAEAAGYQGRKDNAGWVQSNKLAGPLGDAATGLKNQAGFNLAGPMDWGQFGTMNDGSGARQQAIDAAYGQATSRLDPQWAKREEAARTQLVNQGLDPGSEAFKNQMSEMGNQRNDAYSSAMNAAIGQGTQAGESAFRQNMMARQQSIAEALRKRGMPVDELKALQGFNAMPGVPQTNDIMNAKQMQQAQDMQIYQMQQQKPWDIVKGVTEIGSNVAGVIPGL